MFIGHYSVAFALKSIDTKISLGFLFMAVQFVDILFFPFVYMGIEKFNLVENFTQSTHFELEFMPYTHGLASSLGWAFLAYTFFVLMPVNKTSQNKKTSALIVAVAVLSHWFLDLLMHTPDLPLFVDDSLKVGFGLWNNVMLTLFIESALLFIGVGLYLRATQSTSKIDKYGILAFSVFMIAANIFNLFGPFPSNKNEVIVSALFAYFCFAGIAYWLDKSRI